MFVFFGENILYQKTGPFNYFLSYFNMFFCFPKAPGESRKLSKMLFLLIFALPVGLFGSPQHFFAAVLSDSR